MPREADGEHFIPLRKDELIDLLCQEDTLPPAEQAAFRQFCALVSATYHYQFNQRLEQLKSAYAPFDPDTDTQSLARLGDDEKQKRLNALLRDFAWLLEQADFRHLGREEIEPTLKGASDWGLRMQVNFGAFEHLAIFVRGESKRKLIRRHWRHFWREEETEVPSYRRLVLILKLRVRPRMGRSIDTEKVYLKVFKDIPKLDVKMLLPTARVRMTRLDRTKVGLPFLSGVLMALWNMGVLLFDLIQTALSNFAELVVGLGNVPVAVLWGISTGAIGYGTKSYFAYQGTKQRHKLVLTESLYFQNLDSNAGVLFRLLDEAEEQSCREAILAYFFLWRHAGEKGWTSADLDQHVERQLERYAHLKVDFEIGDAIHRLEKLRLVEKQGDRYRAQPLAQAFAILDETWNNCFKVRCEPIGRSQAPATAAGVTR